MNKYLGGLVLASFAVTAAMAVELPERIKTSRKVTVATQPVYPPMEYRDPATGELKGIDIELGRALGRHVTARKNEFKTPSDLCGKTIGMSKVTLFPDQATKWSAQNCEAAGRPPIVIFGTASSADARTQLKQGRVDAAVQGMETLPFIMNQEKDAYFPIGEPFADVFQGIGFAKDNTPLRDAYAAALKVLMENGEYRKILAEQGLEATALDAVQINGEIIK